MNTPMTPQEYISKLMLLGFETGRGNQNAFQEVFGGEEKQENEPAKLD